MKYTQEDIDRIKRDYDLESLKFYLEIAERDIKKIQAYIVDVLCQKEKVKNTTFKQYVYIDRRKEYNGKVKYYVGLKIYPVVLENQKSIVIYRTEEAKVFAGKEKKQAKEYAQELMEKYDCEVREE